MLLQRCTDRSVAGYQQTGTEPAALQQVEGFKKVFKTLADSQSRGGPYDRW